MEPAFRRSLESRLVVGGWRPVLLGQRNRLRMRVAALLVVDGLSLCKGDAGAVISERVNL